VLSLLNKSSLGRVLHASLIDDNDTQRQVKPVYWAENKLRDSSSQCSAAVLRPMPHHGLDYLAQLSCPRGTRTKTCYHNALGFISNVIIAYLMCSWDLRG